MLSSASPPNQAIIAICSEGPDDMPSHIKSMLTSVSLSIPVIDGRSALGTWQGVYVIEHRTRAHGRKVELHFVGTCQTCSRMTRYT